MRSLLLTLALLLSACSASSHSTQPAALGQPSRAQALLAVLEQPGPLEVQTVRSTGWAVTRAGLINLEHPKAKAAGLTDGDEPIEVSFHVLRHPRFGTFIIDTGVERALRDAPERAAVRGRIARELHVEKMDFAQPLGDWLAKEATPVAGVFFTHLHLDHVSGAPDLARGTPIYAGPGETRSRAFLHLLTRSSIDRALEGLPPVSEWGFTPDPDGRFAGVVDVFGDGSLFALWTPGHSAGSTAYLARTPTGPVLFTGDTSHTAWGWEHDVEPGEFTGDHALNAKSLATLRTLVKEHPAISVRLGHQALP
ncbi:MAG TPA: MBL fold metallo-hydrolase [Aggregicoccus sp.]|nr:MBL fold metallo-hydrolase [Aggregicoccus sp.]